MWQHAGLMRTHMLILEKTQHLLMLLSPSYVAIEKTQHIMLHLLTPSYVAIEKTQHLMLLSPALSEIPKDISSQKPYRGFA